MARVKRKMEQSKAPSKRTRISEFAANLLMSSMPDLGGLDFLRGPIGKGASWFDNPKLLERHQRARSRRRSERRRLHRVRRARGQNARTGAK